MAHGLQTGCARAGHASPATKRSRREPPSRGPPQMPPRRQRHRLGDGGVGRWALVRLTSYKVRHWVINKVFLLWVFFEVIVEILLDLKNATTHTSTLVKSLCPNSWSTLKWRTLKIVQQLLPRRFQSHSHLPSSSGPTTTSPSLPRPLRHFNQLPSG